MCRRPLESVQITPHATVQQCLPVLIVWYCTNAIMKKKQWYSSSRGPHECREKIEISKNEWIFSHQFLTRVSTCLDTHCLLLQNKPAEKQGLSNAWFDNYTPGKVGWQDGQPLHPTLHLGVFSCNTFLVQFTQDCIVITIIP